MKWQEKFSHIRFFLAEWWRTLDRGLLWSGLAIILCGIFLTFAASVGVAERVIKSGDSFHFVKRQLFFGALSVGVILGTSMLSPKHIRRIALITLVISFFMLLWLPVFGQVVKGATRWITLFGVSIQPSEFAKPAFAIFCAWIFASGRLIKNFPGIPIAAVIFLLFFLLLFLQPDFGMILTFSAIWGAEIFLAGLPLLLVIVLIVLGVVGGGVCYLLLPHMQQRIAAFLNADSAENFQIKTALQAFRNGGWFGLGPGEGIIKAKLPDAHTDFIFAVAAEEFGFLLCIFLVFLFCFLIFRGFYVMAKEKNLFNILAAAGLLTQFGVQALINMLSTLSLIPTKGMTLPFISYGGSSLLSLAFGFGVILSLTRRHPTQGGLE